MHLTLNIAGQPTSEAFYDFSKSDFSSLALTLTNGLPTDIVFAFNAELPFSATGNLASTYAAISGDTVNDQVVNFYFGTSPTAMNLAAHDGEGGITLVEQGVPEPTTWTLVILGFGAIGAVMRRRRAAISFSHS